MRGTFLILVFCGLTGLFYSLNKPTPKLLQAIPQTLLKTSNQTSLTNKSHITTHTDSNIEILVNLEDALNQSPDSSKGTVARSNRILAEVELNKKTQKYVLKFKKPLTRSLSLMFVGADGKVNLEDVKVFYLNNTHSIAKNLNNNYLKNDWYRFESGGETIVSLSFAGRSFSPTGKIALYSQEAL